LAAARAAEVGIAWLLELQNSDGGWPTFYHGKGKLPFERSGSDVTAHALQALWAWRNRWIAGGAAAAVSNRRVSPHQPRSLVERIEQAISRGLAYLDHTQRADGTWVPLWFGSEQHPHQENPLYGTARVLLALSELGRSAAPAVRRGLAWLCGMQQISGGWHSGSGGSSTDELRPRETTEETALAVEALLAAGREGSSREAAQQGLEWLAEAVGSDRHKESAPIGFSYGKLWYYEELYPLAMTVSALGRALGEEAAGRQRRGAAARHVP